MPLIDQQEALDALTTQAEEMSHWHERYAEQRKGILTAVNIISDLPTVQPNQNSDLDDCISRQEAVELAMEYCPDDDGSVQKDGDLRELLDELENLPPVRKIIRCYECKHNPKKQWFGCPMAHLNERQRPEDAWCWRGEEEDDGAD